MEISFAEEIQRCAEEQGYWRSHKYFWSLVEIMVKLRNSYRISHNQH